MAIEPKRPTQVLVVDDSSIVCEALRSAINMDPTLQVVGTASNGKEAVELVAKLRPDLVTMDISMPVMDGFEATRQIMAYHPTPILVISSSVFDGGSDLIFKAMSYGALDVMNKMPFKISDHSENSATSLTERIKMLARVRVVRHPLAKLEAQSRKLREQECRRIGNNQIIAIAASTGGPQALLQIFKSLPREIGCGIVVVQHISEGFDRGLAEWLDAECELSVKLAADGDRIEAGTVHVAPTGFQMRVQEGGVLRMADEPTRDGHKPSGTLLFESVARMYGDGAVAVILTGMGRDGVDGLKQIKQAGGHVIAQDESSCVVFGMPKAAIESAVVDDTCPLDEIAETIVNRLRSRPAKEFLQ